MIVHVVANACTVVAMANAVTVMYVLGIAILSPQSLPVGPHVPS